MLGGFAALIVFLILTTFFAVFGRSCAVADACGCDGDCQPLELDDRAYGLSAFARSFRLAPLITAIGMSIVLSNFIQVTQGRATSQFLRWSTTFSTSGT